MNLTRHNDERVDIEGEWHNDNLILMFTHKNKIGANHFHITLDDVDLEHFISTLIEFQR